MKKLLLIILIALIFPSIVIAQSIDITFINTSTPAVSLCTMLKNNNLRYRIRDSDTNGEVSMVQNFLGIKGYLSSVPTGFFGPATLVAIKKFQSASGFSPTGYVGVLTRSKINAWLCPALTIPAITPTSTTIMHSQVAMIATAMHNQEQANLVGPGLPARLKIPTINVNALIESVGLTPDGSLDVPKDFVNTAWYNLGPRPGANGAAVIDGHIGWKNSVFNNLSSLHKGDKLYVEDENGATVTFVVREFRTYGENDDAANIFGASDGKAHLNLITCFGVWNKVTKSYPSRLVIFTDKVVE
jgi:LPXTG-site transpeptidase (sortase) family protein